MCTVLGIDGNGSSKEVLEAFAAWRDRPSPDERAAFVGWITSTYPRVYSEEEAERYWRFDHISALAWQARAVRSARPAAPLPLHEDMESRERRLSLEAFRSAPAAPRDDAWHQAVLDECFRIEGGYKASDPAGTLSALIDWHVKNDRESRPAAPQDDAWLEEAARLADTYRKVVPAYRHAARAVLLHHLRSRPAAPLPEPDSDSDLLDGALARMDRARDILTDGRPRPECNWGLLATEDIKYRRAARASISAAQPAQPGEYAGNPYDSLALEAAARFSTPPAQPAQPGWKLVPVEPTQEMLDACMSNAAGGLLTREYRATIYRAMLASAPAQPAQEQKP
jgi:hypothetical protein